MEVNGTAGFTSLSANSITSNGTLSVSGASTLTGAVTAGSTITATGDITTSGALKASYSGLYINGKQVVFASSASATDWLRINAATTKYSGVYFGSSVVRTDGSLQVGNGGQYFLANSSGVTTTTITTSGNIKSNSDIFCETLRAKYYDLQTIYASSGGSLLLAPTKNFPTPSTTSVVVAKSGSTCNITINDTSIVTTAMSGVVWAAGYYIKASGVFDGVQSDTMDGTITSVAANKMVISVSGGNSANVVAGTYGATASSSVKLLEKFSVILYKRVSNNVDYRYGILLDSYNTSNNSPVIDVFSGQTSATAVRMGNINGLSYTNGEGTSTTLALNDPWGFYAKGNVYIEGHIVASSGRFANWTISDNLYYNDATPGANSITLSPNGKSSTAAIGGSAANLTWAFTVKNVFGVTTAGAMYSNSGKIGGWNIGTTSLYSGSHSAYDSNVDGIYMDSTYVSGGKQAAWYLKNDGSAKIGTMTLTSAGVLSVPAASITDQLDATQINVSTITIGQSQVTNLTTDLGNKASTSSVTTLSNKVTAVQGTCSQAASDQTKAVTCSNFELFTGALITIKFSTANTYASNVVKLNVNSKGAKNIYVGNTATSSSNQFLWGANAVITFRYDGTGFVVVGEPKTWYGSCDTGASTAAKTDTVSSSATVPGCVVCKGTVVSLSMTNDNTATSPTLNIAGTGAKALYAGNGTSTRPLTSNGLGWTAGSTTNFVFDGQYWRVGDTASLARAYTAYTTATDAATKATSYITYVDATNGIKVHNSGDTTDYVQVNSSAISMYRNSKKMMDLDDSALKFYKNDYTTNPVAKFGSEIVLYKPGTSTAMVTINSNGANFSGSVIATAGSIGNWGIANNAIYSTTTDSSGIETTVALQNSILNITTTNCIVSADGNSITATALGDGSISFSSAVLPISSGAGTYTVELTITRPKDIQGDFSYGFNTASGSGAFGVVVIPAVIGSGSGMVTTTDSFSSGSSITPTSITVGASLNNCRKDDQMIVKFVVKKGSTVVPIGWDYGDNAKLPSNIIIGVTKKDSSDNLSTPFYITNSGKMYCENIEAVGGIIGGFTIGTNKLEFTEPIGGNMVDRTTISSVGQSITFINSLNMYTTKIGKEGLVVYNDMGLKVSIDNRGLIAGHKASASLVGSVDGFVGLGASGDGLQRGLTDVTGGGWMLYADDTTNVKTPRNINVIKSSGESQVNISVTNGRSGRFAANANYIGLYDVGNSSWVIQSATNQNVTIPHALSVSGTLGTTGNITVTKTSGDTSIGATNGTRNGKLLVNSSGVFGLYDSTNSKWLIQSATDQSVSVPHTFSTQILTGYGWDGTTARRFVQSNNQDGNYIGYISSNASTLGFRGQWGTAGTAFSNRTISCPSSDIRLKENIINSNINALSILDQIKIRAFDWKSEQLGHQNIGFVADEMEQIDSRFAIGGGYDEDGAMNVKSVDTFYLQGYEVKAIQELHQLIKEQAVEIQELKAKIKELKGM